MQKYHDVAAKLSSHLHRERQRDWERVREWERSKERAGKIDRGRWRKTVIEREIERDRDREIETKIEKDRETLLDAQ